MDAFTIYTGRVGIVNRANIDTDQIIPKQFLKSIQRTGFGKDLFYDWRYQPDGRDNPDFELNAPGQNNATILVVGNNFGCGSSREHAVWAVKQFGFRAVIAPWMMDGAQRIPGFADIFRNNSTGNGLLLIELSPEEVDIIIQEAAKSPLDATIDLPAQTITLNAPSSGVFHFDMDAGVKERLVNGWDAIDLTLADEDKIAAFEKTHSAQTTGPAFRV